MGVSTLAERLIDEGWRMEAHPAVVFREGTSGRRPVLIGGPEVADVIGAVFDGDVPVDQRRSRAAQLLRITEALVDDGLAYYAEYTDEIDADLATRARVADEAEALWRRQQASMPFLEHSSKYSVRLGNSERRGILTRWPTPD